MLEKTPISLRTDRRLRDSKTLFGQERNDKDSCVAKKCSQGIEVDWVEELE